jgi:hypothetical protein
MSDIEPKKDLKQMYSEGAHLEAHIIADMLRIENITTELRDLKQSTEKRLDKMENWIIGIVALTTTTLLSVVTALLIKALGV